MKRYRKPKIKPNSLVLQRGKINGELDMCLYFNNISNSDRALIFSCLCANVIKVENGNNISFFDELEKRGYDLDTLKFSIEKKKTI